MHRESDRLRAFSRRAALLGAGKLGLFGLLAGRLHYIQAVDADRYALLADENRINQRLLPPARGRITDRHGVTVATNVPIVTVSAMVFVPFSIRSCPGPLIATSPAKVLLLLNATTVPDSRTKSPS